MSPEVESGFRSGFVSLVGRPNVGKSTLLNAILKTKVSITSTKPQTTRTQVRGILNRAATESAAAAQIVFVDTPGVHRPRSPMGTRLNETASAAIGDVDVVALVIDATADIGPGDRHVASLVPRDAIVVVNKIDAASRPQIARQLSVAAAEFDLAEYFPVSARTGAGLDVLVAALGERLDEGPAFYPPDVVTDVPEAFWVAELVREQLLAAVREELPHSIACVVTEWDWPRIRCEILVERESQKPIVIGSGGSVLKAVGTAVRAQLTDGAFLELFVRVDKNWQHREQELDRLGY